MSRSLKCRCCGQCCLNLIDAYNGCVSDADLDRWRKLGRSDLLDRVRTLDLGPDNKLHTAWVDPDSGEDVDRCPWLLDRTDQKGHLCGIEEIKPDHCRAYPEHKRHAEATGCNGFSEK
jgi:Fe-S-cluster containining protein